MGSRGRNISRSRQEIDAGFIIDWFQHQTHQKVELEKALGSKNVRSIAMVGDTDVEISKARGKQEWQINFATQLAWFDALVLMLMRRSLLTDSKSTQFHLTRDGRLKIRQSLVALAEKVANETVILEPVEPRIGLKSPQQ